MLHTGTGPTHVKELLSSINIPSLGESALKASKREVGPQIEKLAKELCLESLESKRNLWKDDSEKENVEIGVSYDMACSPSPTSGIPKRQGRRVEASSDGEVWQQTQSLLKQAGAGANYVSTL